LGEHSIWYKHV